MHNPKDIQVRDHRWAVPHYICVVRELQSQLLVSSDFSKTKFLQAVLIFASLAPLLCTIDLQFASR